MIAKTDIGVEYFPMSQTERVFDILYHLSAENGTITLSEIMERYGISRRQAVRDIEYVRTRILPSPEDLIYDWKRRAYRLSEDAETLTYWRENMIVSLSIYNTAAGGAAAHQALEDTLPEAMRRILGHIDYRTQVRSRIDDERWLSPIFTAFDRKCMLRVRYRKSPDSASEDRIVNPLRLVNYQNVWYLIAYDVKRKGVRTFRLSRAEAVFTEDSAAPDYDESEISNLLDSAYGIFLSDDTELYTMRFSGGAAARVSSEIWHEKQKTRWIGDEYELSLPAASSVELLSRLLSYGDEAYPVAPESFVKEYSDTVHRMNERYFFIR